MHRQNIGIWLRYAKWEDSQQETERARSVYERALDVDYKEPLVWMRYAEMEMRCKFVSRARNVWDRAVTLLPRVDALWYKYTFMEEMLGNVNGARAVFERWVAWEPPEQVWLSYIKLEERAKETERARGIWERFVACHPGEVAYLRFAKWEERHGQRALARRIFERATEELREDERGAPFYEAFAKFEERCGELARATAVYRFALERIPKVAAEALHSAYVAFEKQHGNRRVVEGVILSKRRGTYAEALAANPRDYDAWFDLVRLEEAEVEEASAALVSATARASAHGGAADGDVASASAALDEALSRCRDTYERAVAAVPPLAEKRFWRRYIYLWIYYAVWEETSAAHNVERARAVYRAALRVVPHASFTFSKLWLLAAQLEVRARALPEARRLLGTALGACPKEKVMRGYIALELSLGEIDRVRKLYERYLSLWPASVAAWVRFADLERSVGEDERARAIYELAVSQSALDLPEVAWKAFIDFEIERGDADAARALYKALLARTQHVKVWLSLAAFEATVAGDAAGARDAYAKGYAHFKSLGSEGREPRALLLDAWCAFETALHDDAVANGGDVAAAEAAIAAVNAKIPRRVVKRREALDDAGVPTGAWEEYYDYVFPDDEAKPASLKLLELAQRWKAGGGSVTATLQSAASAADVEAPADTEDDGHADDALDAAPRAEDMHIGGDAYDDGDDPNALNLDASASSEPQSRAGTVRGRNVDVADANTDAMRAKRPRPADDDTRADRDTEQPDDAADEATPKVTERAQEDAVRAAQGSSPPRDLYCEEDEGDAADRDV